MPSLADVYGALSASLAGQPPGQTIDLWSASAKPALSQLRTLLARFRIGATYELTAATLTSGRSDVVLTGAGIFAMPGGPSSNVTATLVWSGSDGDPGVELSLAFTDPGWSFAHAFHELPQSLVAREGGGLRLGPSFLEDPEPLELGAPRLTARSGDEQLTLSGTLGPRGCLVPFEDWIAAWPLALTGSITLPEAASKPPAFDLVATAPGRSISLGPLTLRAPGFRLLSLLDDHDVPGTDAYSQLDFTATLEAGGGITAELSGPLLLGGGAWVLTVGFGSDAPRLTRGVAWIGELFGVSADVLELPPGLTSLEAFRLTVIEVWMPRSITDPYELPQSVENVAVTVESTERWRPPIPRTTIKDLGVRLVVNREPIDLEFGPALAGSAFGSIEIETTNGPAIIDVIATFPQFALAGSLRQDSPAIPLGVAFHHFLGEAGPAAKPGMEITELTVGAVPSEQSFSASATIATNWKLDFFAGIELQALSFRIAISQSSLGGAIEGVFRVEQHSGQPEDEQPTFYVGAEHPGGSAAGWTFSGGLSPGSQLEVIDLVKKFLNATDPPPLPKLTIERLDATISTADQSWAFGGAIASEWRPTVAGTELTIRAGVSVDLRRAGTPPAATPTPTTTPKVTGRLEARISVNRLALQIARDIGVADPSFSIRVQFDRLWVQASTGSQEGQQVLTIQLGGVTLGELLEYVVDLAAPTLGFQLEPPWDALKRIDLARFTVTVALRDKWIEVVYVADADLLVMQLTKVTVRYRMGTSTAVDLKLEGTFLGRPLAKPLVWDVTKDPPPAVPGKGASLLDLRFLGLGQRVSLDKSPDTVAGGIALMKSSMAEVAAGATRPKLPPAVKFDAGARWLVGLEASVMGTLDLAVVLNDPGLYGVSIGLNGERAGSLAGLRFELLYKRITDDLGVFRAELRVPDAYRRLQLGAVSVTLGLIVVEVYTNGNFMIDLGFPHGRDYERSFTVEAFPFIGRGGLYFGVLNGATSRRVPAVTNGTFSPVLELGVGLAVGVGKEVRFGPVSGSIYVEVEVIFQGVLGWFNPAAAGAPTALYHWGQGIAAIHGKLHGQVDFKVIKVAVTVEASVQASVRFEAHRATVFELSAELDVEAEAEVLFVTVEFSFHARVETSFTVGRDEQAPWALADGQGRASPARMRRNVLPPATRDPRRLAAARRPESRTFTWDPSVNVFGGQIRDVPLSVLPAFTLADLPVAWSATPPPNADPAYRGALLVLAQTGAQPGGAERTDAASPAADLVEALLRWSLSALRGSDGKPVTAVTAGELDALLAELDDPSVDDDAFSLASLSTFFGANLRLQLTGRPPEDPTGATKGMLVAAPPYLDLRVKPEAFETDLATHAMIGRRYLWDVSRYMADFDPLATPATDPPADGAQESFATHLFRDWCLLVAKAAVRAATSSLGATTRKMGSGSLDDVAAALPRDVIAYTVRAGDTLDSVAASTGASVAELEHLNPTLRAALASALPGAELTLTIGVAGADLAFENAGLTLAGGLAIVLRGVEVQVRARETLATLATRLSQPSVAKLVGAAGLAAHRGLLRAGAEFEVPSRTDPVPGTTDRGRVAAIAYVRYFADPDVPDASWYAQRIGSLNPSILTKYGTAPELPENLELTVPTAAHAETTETYTTLAGDSLLRIGSALSLIHAPSGYASQAWQSFLASVTAADGKVTVPAAKTRIAGGETLELLAHRLLATSVDALLPWVQSGDVLSPLALFELDVSASTTTHTTLAALAEAYGLALDWVTSRPEVTARAGLFPAATELSVSGLPAQTVEALASAARAPAALASVAGQISRHMLSGTRLPAPQTIDGEVRGSGPVTGIYEIAGLQFPAPVPDGSEPDSEALAISVAAADPPPWLTFAEAVLAPDDAPLAVSAGDAIDGVELRFTNAQLLADYPASALGVTPSEGPARLPLAASARRTYGLDHRIELQAAVPLAIPPGLTAVSGNPSLWPFGAALLERARSGSTTRFDVRRAGGAGGGPETVAGSTFGTLIPFSVRRVAGHRNLYELAGAQGDDQDLLLRLVRYVRDDPKPPATTTQLRLLIAPAPDAASVSGLAVLDASTAGTYAIRANLATDLPHPAAPTVLAATLGESAHFLQLLWEAGAAGGGFHLGFVTADGQDLPPGAFADDGTATLHLLAVPREQQAAPAEGRALLAVDNCVLVAPGTDPSVHALWLEMNPQATDAGELVKRALVPPGTYGIAMTLPCATAAIGQLYSLAITRLATGGADAPPITPQRTEHEQETRWRYEQALPLARLGPASKLPEVGGLPDPAGDPYRGFGDKTTAQTRALRVGLGDLLGNRSSSASERAVDTALGYTDPLIGAAAWPATALDYGLARAQDLVTLSVRLTPRPGLAVPGPGEPPAAAREAAARQAARLEQAYYQVAQPTLSASVLTTLRQNTDGSPRPVATTEGTAPLRDHLAASYAYTTAAAALEPVRPEQGATLGAIREWHGLTAATLARANEGVALRDAFDPAGTIAATAHMVFAEMDTATTIRDRVPSGWPKPATAAALLELADNANVLPLRAGTAVRVPDKSVPVTDPATATLASVAKASATTPAWLAIDIAEASILRDGFVFEWGAHAVTVGTDAKTLTAVRDAFVAVNDDVSCADLAVAHADAPGIFADGKTLILKHAVARAGQTLGNLAGSALAATAALNVDTPNLFEAGALVSLGAWSPQPIPSTAETLAELAERLGTTPELIVAGNPKLAVTGKSTLVLPGIAALPDRALHVPYSVGADDTLTSVAKRFATTALALAEANRNLRGTLTPARQIVVTVAGKHYQVKTGPDESFEQLYRTLLVMAPDAKFADVVHALAPLTGALRTGALLIVAAPALAAPATSAGAGAAALTAAQVEQEYHVGSVAFAAANAAVEGLVAPGVKLVGGAAAGSPSTTTAESDTLNAVLGRLAEAGARIGLEELLALNPGAALYQVGASALLPPVPRHVSALLGDAGGPFATPAFPLTAALRLERAAATIHPDFSGDGPERRADSTVPAPVEGKPGESLTFDAFVDDCLAALPHIRLATARTEDRGADLWAVDFGTGGIASVSVAPGVAGTGGTKRPRCYAVRPPYHDLWSATAVAVSSVGDDGKLSDSGTSDFQGVDVEVWARAFAADVDLFVSAPYAAGIFGIAEARPALTRILKAKAKVARAMAEGLAPVEAIDAPEAAQASAVADLERRCAVSLADGYDVAATVQYDATVESAYVGAAEGARLVGLPQRHDSASDHAYTLTAANTSLGAASSYVEFELTARDPTHRRSALLKLDYVYDALDVDIAQVEGMDSYESMARLSFVRPLDGSYRPAAIPALTSAPTVPLPLRAHPPVPVAVEQTAAPTFTGPDRPPLDRAGEWTYAITYRHEHAAQDHVALVVTFGTAGEDASLAAPDTDALGEALARYAGVADRLRDLMSWYADPPDPAPPELGTVRANAAAAFATLAEGVADAWSGHWEPPVSARAAVSESSYAFRLKVGYGEDGSTIASVTVECDPPTASPGPLGEWPDLAFGLSDGAFVELTAGTPASGRLVYTLPEPAPAGEWPAIRLAWPGLDVATIESGHASLAARRNENLVEGVTTNPEFVLGTASVEVPGRAVPLLEWTGEWWLTGSGMGQAIQASLDELLGAGSHIPIGVDVEYGYDLSGSGSDALTAWVPVALRPAQAMATDTGSAIAEAVRRWREANDPAESGAKVALSVRAYSGASAPGERRPLLTLGRLVYALRPTR